MCLRRQNVTLIKLIKTHYCKCILTMLGNMAKSKSPANTENISTKIKKEIKLLFLNKNIIYIVGNLLKDIRNILSLNPK